MFRTVTLPASRYGLLISLVVVFVLVLTDFGVPKVVGGVTVMLATGIYKEVVGQQRLDRGAVVAMLLLLPALGAFVLEQRLRARQRAVLSLRAVPHVPSPRAGRDLAALLTARWSRRHWSASSASRCTRRSRSTGRTCSRRR